MKINQIKVLNDEIKLQSEALENSITFLLSDDKVDCDVLFNKNNIEMKFNKKTIKLTVGTVLYNNTDSEIGNLEHFSKNAISYCKDNLSDYEINFNLIYIDNSPIALENANLLIGWNKIENKLNIGFARGPQ